MSTLPRCWSLVRARHRGTRQGTLRIQEPGAIGSRLTAADNYELELEICIVIDGSGHVATGGGGRRERATSLRHLKVKGVGGLIITEAILEHRGMPSRGYLASESTD